MPKLKKSGHFPKYRKHILDSTLKAFDKLVQEDKEGTKPLFRNRAWNGNERALAKRNKKNNWCKDFRNLNKIEYKSLMFVPPTPNGELIKDFKQREAELNKSRK